MTDASPTASRDRSSKRMRCGLKISELGKRP